MSGRASRLVTVVCLSIVAASIVFISSKSWGMTYAASQPSEQSNQYITISPAVTPTLEPRAYLPAVMRDFCQPVTVPAYAKLFGVVFFDYNGDGSQQPNEPGIAGANISVGNESASSQCNGVFYFLNLPDGSYSLTVLAAGFRYLSISTSDIRAIGTPIAVTVSGHTQRNIGLAQGFLTLPFGCCPPFTRESPFGMTGMFDVDRRVGYVRSYDPEHVKPDYESNGTPPWVYDQHDGVDYCFPVGTEIVAAAPGTVREVGYDAGGAGHYIVIQHPYNNSQTLYAHLSQTLVTAGTEVSRGQSIAKSGNTGNSGEPHLHFRYATWETPPNPIDPYRDLTNPASTSHWTVDNSPQYPY